MTDEAAVNTSRKVREEFGDQVVLLDDQEESVVFRILEELTVGDADYIVLQSDAEREEDAYSIFRLSWDGDNPELSTIDDEDEWERVSECYDELSF